MPVHHCCSGSWSLGRFWVQWQEPAQQNSPATIWSQSGCLSISKALYCTSLVLLSTAACQQTDDLINEKAKSLWCYAQKELKALLALLGGLSFPCWKQLQQLCKKSSRGCCQSISVSPCLLLSLRSSLHMTLPNPPLGFPLTEGQPGRIYPSEIKGGKKRSQWGLAEERLHIQAWTPGQAHRSRDFQHCQLPFTHTNIIDTDRSFFYEWKMKIWTLLG